MLRYFYKPYTLLKENPKHGFTFLISVKRQKYREPVYFLIAVGVICCFWRDDRYISYPGTALSTQRVDLQAEAVNCSQAEEQPPYILLARAAQNRVYWVNIVLEKKN